MYINRQNTIEKGLASLTTHLQYNTIKTNLKDNNLYIQNEISINCDRYKTCSANICPLDANWQKTAHLKGERVCFYLTETQKLSVNTIFEGSGRGYLYSLMQEVIFPIISRHYPIKIALEQAKKIGSRMSRKIED